eukprot:Lankesteria_metandrocarpae@DN3120_c0_g1_i1.p1
MGMRSFADLDKKTNDVLRNGYVHFKLWQLSLAHMGVSPKLTAMASMSPTGELEAAPSIRHSVNGVTVNCRSGSGGAASVDVNYDVGQAMGDKATPLFKGLNFGYRFARRVVKGECIDSSNLSAKYGFGRFNSLWTFDPSVLKWGVGSCVSINRPVEKYSFALASQVNGTSTDVSSVKPQLGAALSRDVARPWVISVKTAPGDKTTVGKVVAAMCASAESGNAAAAEVSHNLEDHSSAVTLGAMMYISPKNTKNTSLKVKLMPNADVATVLAHKFSDQITGNFGCQFSGKGKQTAESIKYGMKWDVNF